MLRAHGTADDFTKVLFVRITWKPDAPRSTTHDPLLDLLRRALSRWVQRGWLVVVTDQPPEPPPRRRSGTVRTR